MGNLFDGLRDTMFDRVATTMGYTARWQPGNGGAEQTATVLFKDDTQAYELEGNKYDPAQARIEYRKPVFETLKAWVDSGSTGEKITVVFDEGEKVYYVQRVDTMFDGRDLVAWLVPGDSGGDFNTDYNSNDFNVVQ